MADLIPNEQLIPAVKQYLKDNPLATRRSLRQVFQVSIERLQRLEAKGLIVLPKPMPLKAAAIMAARASPWRNNLKLPNTPTNGAKVKPTKVS